MKKETDSFDIVIIGGGPAGCAVAIKAAQFGHKVCMIDRGHGFPHFQFSQSLSPSVLPLLDVLGVRDAFEAAQFPRSRGVLSLWRDNLPRFRQFENGTGFHIERHAFDSILRNATRLCGAAVLSPTTVVGIARANQGVTPWTIRLSNGTEHAEIRANLVVDAAGKRTPVPSKRARNSPPLIAVLGNWRWSQPTEAYSIVEAGEDRWYWAAPRRDGTLSAAVFFDPRSHLIAKTASLTEAYRSLMGESRMLCDFACELLGPVVACDATSRSVSSPLETDLVRIGEASLSLDPVSSQGIQMALAAGLQAAVVVNTWLCQPHHAAAAEVFYRDRFAEMIKHSERNCRQVYADAADQFGTAFWRERSSLRNDPDYPSDTLRRSTPIPDLCARIRLAKGVHVASVAVIRNNLAEFAPAIIWPRAERPVAFLENVPVGELATTITAGSPARDVIRSWSGVVGESLAFKTFAWMWHAGAIEADTAH